MRTTIVVELLCSLLLSCESNSLEDGYPTSVAAEYVLPYPVGEAYRCSQGFNSSTSHNGTFRYAVDFDMPIGTLVTAARSGRVVYLVGSYSDNDHTVGHENTVILMHEDSTYARYVHLTTYGALVRADQLLMPGDTVGLSGNSGESTQPHLHFDVTGTYTGRSDQTIPFDFKITHPHRFGFETGVAYEALPY